MFFSFFSSLCRSLVRSDSAYFSITFSSFLSFFVVYGSLILLLYFSFLSVYLYSWQSFLFFWFYFCLHFFVFVVPFRHSFLLCRVRVLFVFLSFLLS